MFRCTDGKIDEIVANPVDKTKLNYRDIKEDVELWDCLTLLRGESGQTGSSAAREILLIAMTSRIHISK